MLRFGVVLLCLAVLSGCMGEDRVRSFEELRNAPLYTFNERELDAYLRDLRGESVAERVTRFARKSIGQPYRIFLLGEYPYELHDPDPMVCLEASDCVTFVEHVYAMALSLNWPSFFRTLQRLRYKDGEVGFLTRNHFTEADWNVNNEVFFDDVTSLVAEDGDKAMEVRVDRAAFFLKHGIERGVPVERFKTSYIPRQLLPEAVNRLKAADVIEIVRGTAKAPYVGHMGLILDASPGNVTLVHSARPKVREEPLLEYVAKHETILGIKVLRLKILPRSGICMPGRTVEDLFKNYGRSHGSP